MTYKSISDHSFKNKTVLMRADLNVPVQNGQITNKSRLERIKPTLDYLKDQGAKIVLLSHFGRPKGQEDSSLSLEFMCSYLKDMCGGNVHFASDCIGESTKSIISSAAFGDIVLLENARFHMGEARNDSEYAKRLSELADTYVNDAFSVSHRAHASVEAITKFLPSYAGFLMNEELSALNQALEKPERPLLAIVGGSKISTKLDLLNNIIEKVDTLILGGAMANTFLYAQGHEMGASMCEKDMKDTALNILSRAKDLNCTILLPKDGVVATKVERDVAHKTKNIADISVAEMMLDAGSASIEVFKDYISQSKTVLWNGPLGVFEVPPFDQGTNALATFAAELNTQGKLDVIAGGGDTVAALDHAGIKDKLTYVSTAGGAFLEWLEGKILPGVAALMG